MQQLYRLFSFKTFVLQDVVSKAEEYLLFCTPQCQWNYIKSNQIRYLLLLVEMLYRSLLLLKVGFL